MLIEFIKDEEGQDLVEYSLLLALIGVAALLALTAMGQSITTLFSKVSGKIDEAGARLDGGN